MEKEHRLLELTADIVAAHVANNRVAAGEVPAVIIGVYEALGRLHAPAEAPQSRRQPKLSPRAALKPDAIACLICGSTHKMLRRHLLKAHEMTPDEYRKEFELKANYPMVAPAYSERRRRIAVLHGLGRKNRGRARGRRPGAT
jgi:predicted transcriptional regulator